MKKTAFKSRVRGAAMVEYAFLLVCGCIAVAGTFKTLGPKMASTASSVMAQL